MKNICTVFMILSRLLCASYTYFLGGTISWMQEINSNTIRFTYRLTWEKGSGPCGPTCSSAQIGSVAKGSVASAQLSSLHWRCTDGNASRVLSNVNYYVTSVSVSSSFGWEQGENSFKFSSLRKNQTYVVYLDSLPWKPFVSVSSPSVGYMETSVDPRTRSDTGKMNNSPYVSQQPFIGVSYGCSAKVRLPVEDPDGDTVRCRWARSSECGQGCTNSPSDSVKILKSDCTIKINAYNETGIQVNTIYRLAIVIEDFPHEVINIGADVFSRSRAMSRIPLQLTLKASSITAPCSHRLLFVRPTAKNFARFNTDMRMVMRLKSVDNSFYLQTDNLNATEFMASVPRYMTYSIVPDDLRTALKRLNVARMKTTWIIRPFQSGNQQFCVWGLRADGVTSDSHCITDIVMDTNFCSNRACYNNGTCVNLFHVTNETCTCPLGFKPPDCSKEVSCTDSPCENNGSCTQYGLKYSCSCPSGFNGKNCEHEANFCASLPCRNNGTCLDLQHGYLCICSANFTGQNCETDSEKQSGTSNSKESQNVWIAAAISAGGLTALAVLSGCLYALKRANTPSHNATAEPVKGTTTIGQKESASSQMTEPEDLKNVSFQNHAYNDRGNYSSGIINVQPSRNASLESGSLEF